MTAKDALTLMLCVFLAFPSGAGFGVFLRWLKQQKQAPYSKQPETNNLIFMAVFGIGFFLLNAIIHAWRHNVSAVQGGLSTAAIFASMFLGVRAESRRWAERKRSET